MVEIFMASVALAVGSIPEGLPAAITITLAIGVSRMGQARTGFRSEPTDVIFSDAIRLRPLRLCHGQPLGIGEI
jgi:hypothetical protein